MRPHAPVHEQRFVPKNARPAEVRRAIEARVAPRHTLHPMDRPQPLLAKPQIVPLQVHRDFRPHHADRETKVFQRPLSEHEIASFGLGIPGADVTIDGGFWQEEPAARAREKVAFTVKHRIFLDHPGAYREGFHFDISVHDRRRVMHLNWIGLPTDAPKGTGAYLFAKLVKAAHAAGVQRIEMEAAGNPTAKFLNGYYTWARLGGDGPLPPAVSEKLPAELRPSATVQELVQKPGGLLWWKLNGEGMDMFFETRSTPVLDAYLETLDIDAIEKYISSS